MEDDASCASEGIPEEHEHAEHSNHLHEPKDGRQSAASTSSRTSGSYLQSRADIPAEIHSGKDDPSRRSRPPFQASTGKTLGDGSGIFKKAARVPLHEPGAHLAQGMGVGLLSHRSSPDHEVSEADLISVKEETARLIYESRKVCEELDVNFGRAPSPTAPDLRPSSPQDQDTPRSTQEWDNLRREVDKKDHIVSQLQLKIQQLTLENAGLNELLARDEATMSRAREQVAMEKDEEIRRLEQEGADLREELLALRMAKGHLEGDCLHGPEFERQLQVKNKELSQTRAELASLSTQKEALVQSILCELSPENDDLVRVLKLKVDDALEKLSGRCENLARRCEAVMEQATSKPAEPLPEHDDEVAEVTSSIDSTLRSLEEQIVCEKKVSEDLQQRLRDALESLVETQDVSAAEIVRLNSMVSTMQGDMDALQEEHSALLSDLDIQRSARQRAELAAEELRAELQKKISRAAEQAAEPVTQAVTGEDHGTAANLDMYRECLRVTEERDAIKDELDELMGKNDAMRREGESMVQETMKLLEENKKLVNKYKAARKNVSALDEELTATRVSLNGLRARMCSLEEERDRAVVELGVERQRIDVMSKEEEAKLVSILRDVEEEISLDDPTLVRLREGIHAVVSSRERPRNGVEHGGVAEDLGNIAIMLAEHSRKIQEETSMTLREQVDFIRDSMEPTIHGAISEVNRMVSENKMLETRLREVSAKHIDYKTSIDEYQSRTNAELNRFAGEVKMLREAADELARENEDLRGELNQKDHIHENERVKFLNETASLQRKVHLVESRLQEEIGMRKVDGKRVELLLQQTHNHMEEMKRAVHDTENDAEKRYADVTSRLQEQLQSVQKDSERVQNDLATARSQCQDLRSELSAAQHELDHEIAKNRSLEGRMVDFVKATHERLSDLHAALSETSRHDDTHENVAASDGDRQHVEIEKECANLEASVAALQDRITSIRSEGSKENPDEDQVDAKRDEKEKELLSLLSAKDEQLTELSSMLQRVEQARDDLATQNEKLQKGRDEIEQNMTNIEAKGMATHEQLKEEMNQTKLAADTLQAQLLLVHKQHDAIKVENQELEESVSSLRKFKKEAIAQIEELELKLNQKEGEISRVSKDATTYEALEGELASLRDNLRKKSSECLEVQAAHDALCKQLEMKESESQSLKSSCDREVALINQSHERQVRMLTDEISGLTKSVEASKSSAQQATEKLGEDIRERDVALKQKDYEIAKLEERLGEEREIFTQERDRFEMAITQNQEQLLYLRDELQSVQMDADAVMKDKESVKQQEEGLKLDLNVANEKLLLKEKALSVLQEQHLVIRKENDGLQESLSKKVQELEEMKNNIITMETANMKNMSDLDSKLKGLEESAAKRAEEFEEEREALIKECKLHQEEKSRMEQTVCEMERTADAMMNQFRTFASSHGQLSEKAVEVERLKASLDEAQETIEKLSIEREPTENVLSETASIKLQLVATEKKCSTLEAACAQAEKTLADALEREQSLEEKTKAVSMLHDRSEQECQVLAERYELLWSEKMAWEELKAMLGLDAADDAEARVQHLVEIDEIVLKLREEVEKVRDERESAVSQLETMRAAIAARESEVPSDHYQEVLSLVRSQYEGKFEKLVEHSESEKLSLRNEIQGLLREINKQTELYQEQKASLIDIHERELCTLRARISMLEDCLSIPSKNHSTVVPPAALSPSRNQASRSTLLDKQAAAEEAFDLQADRQEFEVSVKQIEDSARLQIERMSSTASPVTSLTGSHKSSVPPTTSLASFTPLNRKTQGVVYSTGLQP